MERWTAIAAASSETRSPGRPATSHSAQSWAALMPQRRSTQRECAWMARKTTRMARSTLRAASVRSMSPVSAGAGDAAPWAMPPAVPMGPSTPWNVLDNTIAPVGRATVRAVGERTQKQGSASKTQRTATICAERAFIRR